MNWQKIDTAPKDGSRVLLTGFSDHDTCIGFWNDYHKPAHWCFNGESDLKVIDQPSHWMPLPPPPAE